MHSLFMWVCGVNQVQRPGNWDSEFASTASPISSSAPLFIRAGVGALFAIVTPAIIMKLIKFVRGFFHGNISSVGNNAGLLQQQPQQGRSNVTIGTEYVASHDFEGKDSTELSFKRGDRVIVLDHNACPGQELWADAEMGGKKGKVPMNFFASSSSSSSSSSSTSTSSPTTQSSTATTSSYTSFTPSSYSTSSITTPISTSSSSSYLSSNKTHPVTSF